jgi:hypothetical protein
MCLCVHILSLVHVVSLDICEVKIAAQACIQKISEHINIRKYLNTNTNTIALQNSIMSL